MHRSVVVAGIVACALIAACGGGGDDDDEATSTPSVAVTVPAATETATPAGIRSIDLQNSEPVQDLIDVTGGLYVQDNVLYADLSEDGSEEAIVPLSSGGTLGDVGFLVLAEADGGVEPLLTVTPEFGGIAVSLVDGQLTTIEPVPGPDDPECCPSALRTTVYAWNGSELTVESSNTAPSDGSGAKTPEGG